MPPWTEGEFVANRQLIEDCVDAWVADNCATFDDFKVPGVATEEPSLWSEMPAIDSKLAVGVLVSIQKIVGRDLKVDLIAAGGYSSPSDLKARLLPQIQQVCAGTWKGGKPKGSVTATSVGAAS